MKPIHFVVVVCFAVSSVTLMAEPAQIKDIRNAYQTAQKNANTADKIVIERNGKVCGEFSDLKTEIFLNKQKKPFFIRKSNNNIYTEFLFDNKGEPLFFYNKNNKNKKEERIYYLNNDTSYTLPESLSKQNKEYGVEYKKLFNNYQELMTEINKPAKSLSDKESKNLETRMISVEQAKNNPQIKEMGKEINLKTTGWNKLTITHHYPKDKAKIQGQFYYSDNGKCDEDNNEKLQFVKISEHDNDDVISEDTFKFNQKNERLQHYTFSESVEGTFGEIYFLPNNQVYCLGDLRVMNKDGSSFDYKPAACHQRKEGDIFFAPNYNAENEAQQLYNIFWQVMKIEYGL